jgi:hypothetical protein
VTRFLAGCGCLSILAVVTLLAAIGLGLFWLTDRAVDLTGSFEGLVTRSDEIEAWAQKANAHPYEPAKDGVLSEERLNTFLAVRRDVHEVYEEHKADLEELHRRVEGGESLSAAELLTVGVAAVRMYGDLRLAQVRALAEAGMSEREYYAIQTSVYVATGASETAERTGKLPAEAVSDASRQVQKAIRLAIRTAQREGVPGADRIAESDLAKLETGVARVGEGGARTLAVPRANVELVRKHETELDQYAMHGLALLGL